MENILLGIIQGITEFLPISSSGHIVFLKKFANFSSNNLAQLQVALHLGTLFSIIIYYFKSIKEIVLNKGLMTDKEVDEALDISKLV